MKSQDIKIIERRIKNMKRVIIKLEKTVEKMRNAKTVKIQGRPVTTGYDVVIDGKFESIEIT